MSARPSSFAKDLTLAIAALALAAGVARVLWPRYELDLYVKCHHNLKEIATSLEMYSTDNAGHYPPRLSSLTPDYLKEIPLCPAAGSDTYSGGYQYGQIPDAYTVWCAGRNHPGIRKTWDGDWHYQLEAPSDYRLNQPAYSSYDIGCLLP